MNTTHSRPWAPKAAPSTATHAAPTDTGVLVAKFKRGKEGGEELRLTVDAFEGHQYVKAHVWTTRDAGKTWWPTKKCVTFRARELDEVIAALTQAAEQIGGAK